MHAGCITLATPPTWWIRPHRRQDLPSRTGRSRLFVGASTVSIS